MIGDSGRTDTDVVRWANNAISAAPKPFHAAAVSWVTVRYCWRQRFRRNDSCCVVYTRAVWMTYSESITSCQLVMPIINLRRYHLQELTTVKICNDTWIAWKVMESKGKTIRRSRCLVHTAVVATRRSTKETCRLKHITRTTPNVGMVRGRLTAIATPNCHPFNTSAKD